jgi:hypothetical protein
MKKVKITIGINCNYGLRPVIMKFKSANIESAGE